MASPVEKKKKLSSADHCYCLISSATIGENQQQLLGSSFETEFGEQKKKMEKRILRKIWICNDVWMDIFPFFDHAQLGLKLALLSPHFDALVDAHFNGKSELTIWRPIEIRKDSVTAVPKLFVLIDFTISVEFPLPDRPLPSKIRIKDLWIEYIDHSVIEFLRSNQQIWDKRGIKFKLSVRSPKNEDVQPIWDVFLREIWPILAPNLRHLTFHCDFFLHDLLHHFSPTILSELNNNLIHSIDLSPEGIIGDINGQDYIGQALFEWLHTPTKDGRPKQLAFQIYEEPKEWVNNFKEAFLRATDSSVSFNIFLKLKSPTTIEPFELVNGRTNEKLTLEKKWGGNKKIFISSWIMNRCSIFEGTAAVRWGGWDDKLNSISFHLNGDINCIGSLTPPAEEEEAGQSNGKGNRTVRK